jgi:hypothetical protein
MAIIMDVARGMKALQDFNPPIIHRDLASRNVFVSIREGRGRRKSKGR